MKYQLVFRFRGDSLEDLATRSHAGGCPLPLPALFAHVKIGQMQKQHSAAHTEKAISE
jgi:hypothetical protein